MTSGKPFCDSAAFERLKQIGRDDRDARRLRRALEAVVRLHTEAAGMLSGRKAELFDVAATRAAEALERNDER